jgi:site-specific DNA-methyltransferase (adenine-specific)
MIELNKIYNEDCLEGMKRIEDNFVDLTVTSPPYDNLRTYNGFSWDFECVANELLRITKEGGIVVWVVGDATVKGSETGSSFKQALYFKHIGFNLHDTMIYQTSKPPMNDRRYQQCFEYMFIFSKGKPKTFNPIMIASKYAGKIPKGTFYNVDGTMKKRFHNKPVAEEKIKENIWFICQHQRNGHPAIFPEQLANDHIVSWSNEEDIILDPFMGSGTTAKMALLNNRKFIGFELSTIYCDLANKRIQDVVSKTQ